MPEEEPAPPRESLEGSIQSAEQAFAEQAGALSAEIEKARSSTRPLTPETKKLLKDVWDSMQGALINANLVTLAAISAVALERPTPEVFGTLEFNVGALLLNATGAIGRLLDERKRKGEALEDLKDIFS